jgi:hypothetical protein
MDDKEIVAKKEPSGPGGQEDGIHDRRTHEDMLAAALGAEGRKWFDDNLGPPRDRRP